MIDEKGVEAMFALAEISIRRIILKDFTMVREVHASLQGWGVNELELIFPRYLSFISLLFTKPLNLSINLNFNITRDRNDGRCICIQLFISHI